MTACAGRGAGQRGYEAEVHRTRRGYTLTLRCKDGASPLLTAHGGEPMRWRRLEAAFAFMTEHFGVPRAIRLNLDE